jgi:hypothetical protein
MNVDHFHTFSSSLEGLGRLLECKVDLLPILKTSVNKAIESGKAGASAATVQVVLSSENVVLQAINIVNSINKGLQFDVVENCVKLSVCKRKYEYLGGASRAL